MEILDTQIISYAFKNTYEGKVSRKYIASITAKEFLLVQNPEKAKVNYYVPLPQRFTDSIRDHPFSKDSSDRIVLEFGRDYPTISEFGNLAITDMINLGRKSLFNEALRFLSKEMRKTILRRFDFLLEQEIRCVPLSRDATEIGMSLFYEFASQYNIKQNPRNTIYDILILATTIASSATLTTQDSLLNRFSSEYFQGDITENAGILSIEFGKPVDSGRRKSQESKGYINKGWRASLKNFQGAW